MQRILDFQSIAHSMPDAFIYLACVTRSHILTTNMLAKMDVPNVRRIALLEARDANLGDPRTLAASQSSAPTQKCGRPLGSKDSHPWKRKTTTQGPEEPTMNPTIAYSFYATHEEILDYGSILEEMNPLPEDREISVYYASLDDVWNINEMIVDDALAFAVAIEIMLSNDIEPRSVDECQPSTPPHVNPVGSKWVFVRKHNEKNEIVHYKARLVAQAFHNALGLTMTKLLHLLWM
ncbi:hypothetical protein ACFX10_032180 [Malus domestica]